jgi:2-aminoethylphosphonate-pyruvate transaminase
MNASVRRSTPAAGDRTAAKAAFTPAVHAYYALVEALRAIAPEQSSVVLSAYRLPAGLSYVALHDASKAGGFVVYCFAFRPWAT